MSIHLVLISSTGNSCWSRMCSRYKGVENKLTRQAIFFAHPPALILFFCTNLPCKRTDQNAAFNEDAEKYLQKWLKMRGNHHPSSIWAWFPGQEESSGRCNDIKPSAPRKTMVIVGYNDFPLWGVSIMFLQASQAVCFARIPKFILGHVQLYSLHGILDNLIWISALLCAVESMQYFR